MALISSLAGTSCLLPQDDTVVYIFPKKNRPPRIIGFEPAQRFTLQLGEDCPRQDFKVFVEDPDIEDRIRSRWFADRDPIRNEFRDGEPPQIPVTQTDGEKRSEPAQPPKSLFVLTPIAKAGTHTLEVVISDGVLSGGNGEVQTNDVPEKRAKIKLPDGSEVEDDSYTDSFTWFLTTELTPCR